MLFVPIFHLLFSLITSVLFCVAAVTAASRAPRHLLWTALMAASSVCSAASSGMNLLFMNQVQHGRGVSEMNGILVAQGVLGTLSSLLLLGSAITLVLVLLNERSAVAVSSSPWQDQRL